MVGDVTGCIRNFGLRFNRLQESKFTAPYANCKPGAITNTKAQAVELQPTSSERLTGDAFVNNDVIK